MSNAITPGKSGRRHESISRAARCVSKFMPATKPSEIFVEADTDELPEERRRFALIDIPRHLFSQATAEAAKRREAQRQAA